MSDKECRSLAAEIVRQMMVKDNILRNLFGRDLPPEFRVEPPDPDSVSSNTD